MQSSGRSTAIHHVAIATSAVLALDLAAAITVAAAAYAAAAAATT